MKKYCFMDPRDIQQMCENKSHAALTEKIERKGVVCSVHSSFEELSGIEQEWDAFVEAVGGDIYLSYTWCRTWWDFYGSGRTLRIFIYKNNIAIVGIIPVFFEKQWLGPVWLKIAKFVGSDSTIAMINPPVRSDFFRTVFNYLFVTLFQKEQCDAFWIGPTGGACSGLQQLRELIQEQAGVILIKDSVFSPYTIFLLPEKYDEYYSALSRNQRADIRNRLNLISRSFKLTRDVIRDDKTAICEFNELYRMHNEQWKAQGKLGHFNDWPEGAAFNAKLVTRLAIHGRLRFIRLLADDQVIFYLLCYAFGKRWHWRISARVVGTAWDKYAFGKISLLKDIEAAIAEGVQEIETGAGHYDYKIKLGGQELQLHTLLLTRKQLSCRWRALLFLNLSGFLHFFYYRVWFNRLAPKFSFKRKPLWKLWIRTRL